jgi:hypothetical protein
MNGAGWAEQKIGVNRRLSAAIQLSRSILLAADERGSTPIAHSGLFEPDGAQEAFASLMTYHRRNRLRVISNSDHSDFTAGSPDEP